MYTCLLVMTFRNLASAKCTLIMTDDTRFFVRYRLHRKLRAHEYLQNGSEEVTVLQQTVQLPDGERHRYVGAHEHVLGHVEPLPHRRRHSARRHLSPAELREPRVRTLDHCHLVHHLGPQPRARRRRPARDRHARNVLVEFHKSFRQFNVRPELGLLVPLGVGRVLPQLLLRRVELGAESVHRRQFQRAAQRETRQERTERRQPHRDRFLMRGKRNGPRSKVHWLGARGARLAACGRAVGGAGSDAPHSPHRSTPERRVDTAAV